MLELVRTCSGWVDYLWPTPGKSASTQTSAYVAGRKRLIFPSGTPHIVGCKIYNLQMNKAFIEDVVDRAASSPSAGREPSACYATRPAPSSSWTPTFSSSGPTGPSWSIPPSPAWKAGTTFILGSGIYVD
jgi:hypothetical protein